MTTQQAFKSYWVSIEAGAISEAYNVKAGDQYTAEDEALRRFGFECPNAAEYAEITNVEDITPPQPARVGSVVVHWLDESTGERGHYTTKVNGDINATRVYFYQNGGKLNIGDGENDKVVKVLLVHPA